MNFTEVVTSAHLFVVMEVIQSYTGYHNSPSRDQNVGKCSAVFVFTLKHFTFFYFVTFSSSFDLPCDGYE